MGHRAELRGPPGYEALFLDVREQLEAEGEAGLGEEDGIETFFPSLRWRSWHAIPRPVTMGIAAAEALLVKMRSAERKLGEVAPTTPYSAFHRMAHDRLYKLHSHILDRMNETY